MISKSLSTSERFASLHQRAGKLAEFCQSLYPLLVAHADDWGCLQGDTFTIKHLVHPTSPRRLADFELALKHLHNAGLIAWYDVDDKRYVCIRGFGAHQNLKGHDKDGRNRPIPAPPENINDFAISAQKCPTAPKSALTKEKRTEENLTYAVPSESGTAQVVGDLDDRGTVNGDIGGFLKRFCELYTKYRHGARYMVRREKDVPMVRRLLNTYPRDRLEKLAMVLLRADDAWIAETDRGIGILSTKAAWLDNRLAQYEAEHGEIKIA